MILLSALRETARMKSGYSTLLKVTVREFKSWGEEVDTMYSLIGLTQRKSKLFHICITGGGFTTWGKVLTEVKVPFLPEMSRRKL